MAYAGPVEGWLLLGRGSVYIVKGCEHPLPLLFAVPRVIGGRRVKPGPDELCLVSPCSPSPCTPEPSPTVDPRSARLVAPWEAARLLGGCASRACRAALLLLEHMASAGIGFYGVTGSLAYDPERARDVDIVVYGFADSLKAYRLLRDLRLDGVTEPLAAPDTAWDPGLEATLASRLLVGRVNGVAYSVRLVACREPVRCRPVTVLGRRRVCGRLRHLGPPWVTPVHYVVEGEGVRVTVRSLRLRYTELPEGVRACVEGVLEEVGGRAVLVPDRAGSVELLVDEPR